MAAVPAQANAPNGMGNFVAQPEEALECEAIAIVNGFVARYFSSDSASKRVRFRVSGVTAQDFAEKHSGGRMYNSGVDITDFGRWYTREELDQMKPDCRDAIMEYKKANKGKKGTGDAKKGGGGGDKSKKDKRKDKRKIKKLKARIKSLEAGQVVQQGKSKEDGDDDSSDEDRERIGPGAVAGKTRKKTKVSRVTISKVNHRPPKNRDNFKDSGNEPKVSFLDEDSHADMHCAGSNCVVLARTNYTCDVDPFLESYESTEDVPIVKAATAIQISSGEVIYLVMNSALYFGDRMESSLFNGNLARDAGLSVCTDPYDQHRKLGIESQDRKVRIPMTRRQNVIGLKTYRPDRDDVLRAIGNDDENVVYLNKEDEFVPDAYAGVEAIHAFGHNDKVPHAMEEENREDILADISDVFDQQRFARRMVASVQVHGPSNGDANGARVAAFTSATAHSGNNAERVSQIFGCGIETARQTLSCTTQYSIRNAVRPLTRRYRTDMLSHRYRRLNKPFAMDVMFFKQKSLKQNTCCGVYTCMDYVTAYPIRSKKFVGITLQQLAEDVGIPNELFMDNAPEMLGFDKEFQKIVRRLRIMCKTIEPHTSRQNKAERMIGELRRRWRDTCRRTNLHKRLWDYAIVWIAEIMSRTWNRRTGRTGVESVTGDTPDISEWIDFDMNDRVWYWDSPGCEESPMPARWLGISHRVGSALCYWVINEQGKVLSRTSVQHVTESQIGTDAVRKRFDDLDKSILERLNVKERDKAEPFGQFFDDEDIWFNQEDEGIDRPIPIDPDLAAGDNEENGDKDNTTYDPYIGAEIILDTGAEGSPRRGTVVKRARGQDGKLKGIRNNNPLISTARYEVEIDGIREEYAANQVAECIYAQVDDEGRRRLLLKEIVAHKKSDEAIDKTNGWTTTKTGRKRRVITTKGWSIKIEWKDGTASWLPMSEVKEANPIELAEYAVTAKISDEPAFAWWVSSVLKKRNAIIKKVKGKYWRTTHKFGIKLPHSVEEALKIDKENGNDFWTKAIEKEMARVRVAFKKWDGGTTADEARKKLVGYQFIKCHIVFDIKFDGLVRKARLVAGGHKTDTPSSVTYSSVVSRDSVRIAFLYAALNELSVVAADIGNAYLNAPSRERTWTIAGKEFGEDEGSVYLIVRALYGQKASGAAWRAFFSSILTDLDFVPTRGDPDVYIREAVRPNGDAYYEMCLIYVDDVLLCSHDPYSTIDKLKLKFRLKEDSLGAPTRYLGALVKVFTDARGKECYALSSDDYVEVAVKEVESELAKEGLKLRGRAQRPFDQGYKPEMDITPELDADGISKYQGYMGIFRWMLELGRIDIMTEVSQLSSFQASPREGHLEACYHIFAYLRKHPNMALVMHPSRLHLKEERFGKKKDWSDFYGKMKEDIALDLPRPLGKAIRITCFVDADHAGNVVTRRSQTGIIFFINNAPIIWYSKKQNTVEASTFGSEFIAMRIATEINDSLRYKLRTFGIPIEGPTDVLCDNGSVVNSGQRPESQLSKKHLSICYHRLRECVTKEALRVGKVADAENPADLFTKILPIPKRDYCINQLVWTKTHSIRLIDQHKDILLNKQSSERG